MAASTRAASLDPGVVGASGGVDLSSHAERRTTADALAVKTRRADCTQRS
jgi:hypothetical protein